MGWLFFPSRGMKTVDILKSRFEFENEQAKRTWLDQSERGSTVYAVIQITPKQSGNDVRRAETTYVPDADGSVRVIAVFLTKRERSPDDGCDFGYKDMDESMGPVECDCPKRLIDLASPLREDYTGYARAWREKCLNRGKERREQKAKDPKPGQRFRTLRPVRFDGGFECSEWRCLVIPRRGRNQTVYSPLIEGGLYRFKPANYGFEIIEA